MNTIIDKIKEYDSICIIMHIRPDGDCYGSSFGLKQLILDNFNNKTVYVLGEKHPTFYYMGETDDVSDEILKESLVISVDTGSRSRVADQRFTLGKYLLRIDHHVHIDPFGDYEYIDTESPATSLIITKLAMDFKLTVSKLAASCLFTGIVTDTGRFRYRGVTSLTHDAASFLLRLGFDQHEIYDNVYKKDLKTLKFEGELNTHLHTSENGVLYAKLPRSIIDSSGLTDKQVAEFVSKLADIDGYPVWVLFYQVKNMRIRARIRSKNVPINKVAENYHGGGHKVAAGAVVDSWDEAENLVTELDELLK